MSNLDLYITLVSLVTLVAYCDSENESMNDWNISRQAVNPWLTLERLMQHSFTRMTKCNNETMLSQQMISVKTKYALTVDNW